MNLEARITQTKRFWSQIVETKDLHSKKGEQILALIGKISNIVCFGSWEQAFRECAVEIRLVEKIANELPSTTQSS